MVSNKKCLKILLFFLFYVLQIYFFNFIFKVDEIFYIIIAEIVIMLVIKENTENNSVIVVPERISPVETFELTEEEKNNVECCVICLMEEKENLVKLSCQHVFHKECIRRWLLNSNNCPVCRINLREPNIRSLININETTDTENSDTENSSSNFILNSTSTSTSTSDISFQEHDYTISV